MAKLHKNQRYILTFADGSSTDPLLPSEMSKQDHEEAISVEPCGPASTREEQHARYIDCGPQAWDDRD
jgi:hypothetical protein